MHPKRMKNNKNLKLGGSGMVLGEVVGSLWPPGLPRTAKEMQNPVRGSPRPPLFGMVFEDPNLMINHVFWHGGGDRPQGNLINNYETIVINWGKQMRNHLLKGLPS